jgi:hypothetical protein
MVFFIEAGQSFSKEVYDTATEASVGFTVPVTLALAKLTLLFGLQYRTDSSWKDFTTWVSWTSVDPPTYLGPD